MPFKDAETKRAYQRHWVSDRRAKWMSDKSCVDCGSTQDLEVDHVDPKQKMSHRIWSWSEQRRNAELAKCVVRCREHHWQKTLMYDRHRTDHGSGQMYQVYKCRCDMCKEWKSVSDRKYRRKPGE